MTCMLWAKSELRVSNRTGLFKGRSMARMNKARSAGRPTYSIDVELTIAGIPCGAHIVSDHAGTPMVITGSGFGDAIAPEPAELDFIIVDRRGYRADWLARKEEPEILELMVLEWMR